MVELGPHNIRPQIMMGKNFVFSVFCGSHTLRSFLSTSKVNPWDLRVLSTLGERFGPGCGVKDNSK